MEMMLSCKARVVGRIFVSLCFVVLFSFSVLAINDLMSLQGNVQQGNTNLASGNLTVYIFDAISGGNVVWNSTLDVTGQYNNSIVSGKYDVMLGNSSDNEMNLEYGVLYYIEMYVNTEKFSFNGSDRQIFQSSVGQINASFINPLSINASHLDGNITLAYITGGENVVFSNSSVTFSDGENVSVGVGGWFKGLFNWVVNSSSGYLSFNGTTLSLDEVQLNGTIDDRTLKSFQTSFDLNVTGAEFLSSTALNLSYANLSRTIGKGNLTDTGTLGFDWVDSEVADTISIIGGIIGANSVSGTWTTTGTLTIGDNGDRIDIDSDTWDVANGVMSGVVTLDTGQGANELYDMNQNVLTNSDVVFNTLNVTNILRVGSTLLSADNAGTLNISGTTNFNSGWQDGGVTIANGNVFVQTLYAVNITSLGVSDLAINGSLLPSSPVFNNTFDVGNSTLQWRDAYFGREVYVGGVGVSEWLYNQTAAALGVNPFNQQLNTTSNVSFDGVIATGNFSADGTTLVVDRGNDRVGIGTASPDNKFEILGGDFVLKEDDDGLNGVLIGATNTEGFIDVKRSGGTVIHIDGDGDNYFNPNAGNFGIGTASPTTTLTVNGNTTITENLTVGVTDFVVDAVNNRVGIGTASPLGKFHVETADNTVAFFKSTDTLANIQIYDGNAESLFAGVNNGVAYIGTSGEGDLHIDGDGKVGIGTITPTTTLTVNGNTTITENLTVGVTDFVVDAVNSRVGIGTASPGFPLDVDDNARFGYDVGTNAYMEFRSGTDDSLIEFKDNADAGRWEIRDDSGVLDFNVGTGGAQVMSLLATGKVGIGTTAPATELHIAGGSGNSELTFTYDATQYVNQIDNQFSAGAAHSNFMTFQISDSSVAGQVTAMTLYGDQVASFGGSVGIGTTAPGVTLQVNQTADSSGINVYGFDDASASSVQMYVDSGGDPNINFVDDGSGVSNIRVDGNLISRFTASGFTMYGGNQVVFDSTDTRIYANGDPEDLVIEADQDILLQPDGNVGIGTATPAFSANAKGLDIAGTGGQVNAAQDGTERIPTLRITDTVGDYGSNTATVGEKRGAIEWYSTESSMEMPGISAAIYNINENGYNTQFGTAFYTFNAPTYGGDGLAERMRITYDGRVGIGTASPDNRLNVFSNVNPANNPMVNFTNLDPTDTEAGVLLLRGGANALAGKIFEVQDYSGNTDFIIKGAGNVGIGTTSPSDQLSLSGDGTWDFNLASVDTISRGGSATDDGLLSVDGELLFQTDNNNNQEGAFRFFNGIEGEIMRISENGNVGIGTTTPDGTLEVIGNVTIGAEGDGLFISSDGYLSDEDDSVTVNDDLSIGENDILSINDIVVTAGDAIRGDYLTIGVSGGSLTYADGDGDLWVRDELEVDGTAWLAGTDHWNQGDIAETMETKSSRENKLCEGAKCKAEIVEELNSEEGLSYGDLVCIDPVGDKLITKCTEANSQLVVGFITNTAVLTVDPGAVNGYPIALAGIVNSKVSNTNGNIYPGDLLVSAERDGYAMKNNNPQDGTVVGKAFDFCDEEECNIPVFVALS